MASTTKIFRNDAVLLANELAADDANGIKNENNQLIFRSNIDLDSTNHQQTSQSVRNVGLRGSSYLAAFLSPLVSLSPQTNIGVNRDYLPPTQYFDEQIVYFKSPFTSDGAVDLAIEIGALGSRPFVELSGVRIGDQRIESGKYYKAFYKSTQDKFFLLQAKSNSYISAFPTADVTANNTAENTLNINSIIYSTSTMALSGGNVEVSRAGNYHILWSWNTNKLESKSPGGGSQNIDLFLKCRIKVNGVVSHERICSLVNITGVGFSGQAILDVTPLNYIDIILPLLAGDEISFHFSANSNVNFTMKGGEPRFTTVFVQGVSS